MDTVAENVLHYNMYSNQSCLGMQPRNYLLPWVLTVFSVFHAHTVSALKHFQRS